MAFSNNLTDYLPSENTYKPTYDAINYGIDQTMEGLADLNTDLEKFKDQAFTDQGFTKISTDYNPIPENPTFVDWLNLLLRSMLLAAVVFGVLFLIPVESMNINVKLMITGLVTAVYTSLDILKNSYTDGIVNLCDKVC